MLFSTPFGLVFGLQALVSRLSVVSATHVPGQSYQFVDKFDGLSSNPVNNEDNLVDNRAGGALLYNAFAVGTPSPLVLVPASSPHAIFSQVVQQSAEGQPAFYINNTVTSFDLESVSYALVLTTQNAIGTPVETGTIQLTGRKTDGTSVVESLVFNQTLGKLPGHFVTQKLPSSFVNLVRVDVAVIQAQISTSPVLASSYFDNVAYAARFAKGH